MDWWKFLNQALFARIVIVACVIKMGCTLKCYICDTELNSTCAKINKDSKKPQECTVDGLNNPLNTFLGQLSHIRVDTRFIDQNSEGSEENHTHDFIKYECVKIVSSHADGRQMIHRSCQLKQPNYCDIIIKKAWEKSEARNELIEIVDCRTCDDKDNCNGSTTIQKFPLISIIGTIIIYSVFF